LNTWEIWRKRQLGAGKGMVKKKPKIGTSGKNYRGTKSRGAHLPSRTKNVMKEWGWRDKGSENKPRIKKSRKAEKTW